MVSGPPSRVTFTRRPVSPRRAAATAAAPTDDKLRSTEIDLRRAVRDLNDKTKELEAARLLSPRGMEGVYFPAPALSPYQEAEISLLVRAGLATSEGLKKKRRYAILIAFVAAAILTPPDPLSQIGLAVPIILLYEVSIYCGVLIERRKRERDKALGLDVGDDEDGECGAEHANGGETGIDAEPLQKAKPQKHEKKQAEQNER